MDRTWEGDVVGLGRARLVVHADRYEAFLRAGGSGGWLDAEQATGKIIDAALMDLMDRSAVQITAEFLWRNHRLVLGGKSSITGAPIPETMAECSPGPQGAHWGMALAVARAQGAPEPPVPPGVSAGEAARIRQTIAVCSTAG